MRYLILPVRLATAALALVGLAAIAMLGGLYPAEKYLDQERD